MATLAIWSPRVIYIYIYIYMYIYLSIYLKPQMSMFAVNPEALVLATAYKKKCRQLQREIQILARLGIAIAQAV